MEKVASLGKEASTSWEERLERLQADLKDAMEISFGEMQALVNETARVQREVNDDYRDRIESLERRLVALDGVAPSVNEVIPRARQGEFIKGYQELMARLSKVKTAMEAQRVWYGAGDAATQLMEVTGQRANFVHLEKHQVVLGSGALLALGAAAGFGAAHVMRKQELQRSKRSRAEYSAWLRDGLNPAITVAEELEELKAMESAEA